MMKILKVLLAGTILSLACANATAIGMQGTTDVKDALDQTIAHLEKAVAAFEKNNHDKAVIGLLMEAKQVQKSFSTANGKLSMIKSKATHKLGQARSSFNDGDLTGGGAAMKEALAGFKEFKEKYNALH